MITLDSTSSFNADTELSSYSIPHTVAGDSRILIIAIASLKLFTSRVIDVKYAGVSMTQETTIANGGTPGQSSTIYSLVAPALGTNNITITLTSIVGLAVAGVSLNGVLQINPVDVTGTTLNVATSIQTTVVTTKDNTFLVDICAQNSNLAMSADVGQTEVVNATYTGAGHRGGGSFKSAAIAGNVTLGWSGSSRDRTHAVIALKPITLVEGKRLGNVLIT